MMLNPPQGNRIGSDDSQQESRNHPAVGAVPVPTPTRMGIDRSARDSPFKPEGGGFDPHQSPAVLEVKPAAEDVDAQSFLAFFCA